MPERKGSQAVSAVTKPGQVGTEHSVMLYWETDQWKYTEWGLTNVAAIGQSSASQPIEYLYVRSVMDKTDSYLNVITAAQAEDFRTASALVDVIIETPYDPNYMYDTMSYHTYRHDGVTYSAKSYDNNFTDD